MQSLGTLNEERHAWKTAFNPDGYYLATTSWMSAAVIWNILLGSLLAAATREGFVYTWLLGEESHKFEVDDGAPGLSFSPDGKLLVVGDSSGTISLWRVIDGANLVNLKTRENGITRQIPAIRVCQTSLLISSRTV